MGPPSKPVAEGQPTLGAPGSARAPHRWPALPRRLALLRALGFAFRAAAGLAAAAVVALVAGLTAYLLEGSLPSIHRLGLSFLTSSAWDGTRNTFGALPEIVGTLLSSALALLLAVPVALGVAIFLSEVAPPRLRRPLSYLVDLSAAVPSVVYGFWAFYVLRPWLRTSVEPGLQHDSGGLSIFAGIPTGVDLLAAVLVLTVMIVPTIAAVSREALEAVPHAQRESALSLGATRWEATRLAVLGPARSGIVGAVILGLGRAVGETIAVVMIIGNIPVIPYSLLSPAVTLAAQLANRFSDVGPGPEQSALIELGLILLLLTLLVNILARVLIWGLGRGGRQGRTAAGPETTTHRRLALIAHRLTATGLSSTLARAPRAAGSRDAGAGRYPNRERRRAREYAILTATVVSLALAVVPLASVIATATYRGGAAVVTPSFYLGVPPIPCNSVHGATCSLGGIGPEIEGTLAMLAIASLVAIPVGLLAGIYLSEYARGRQVGVARIVSFLADVMTGVPTILVGVFVYLVFLTYDHNSARSAYSGGIALGAVMVPIVTRATEEALRAVPSAVREAGLALGFPRYRVTLRLVLGSARSGLVTGTLLALSRAAGDTAALLATAGGSSYWIQNLDQPTGAITPFIFLNFESTYQNIQADAWGAALVLLAIMLTISVVARLATRGRSTTAGGR